MGDLPKAFNHAEVDPKWYAFWESIGAFTAHPEVDRPRGERFSMVLPPPNVTGSLHIGHALNQTLPDIIIRWKRMGGLDVLWLPGTDHAGIATQNVVEKHLAAEGKTRHDLGREAFEARVWEWVKHSHGTITGQMRKLGSSVDWSRERFTLDPGLSRAVRRVFVELYGGGLIYRDRYIVNWCPRCRTALSDLEVVHRDMSGKLYHIRYPGIGIRDVQVATTRPETMLGDTAVAVSPSDGRYRDIVGSRVRLPIIGRELPIVADEFVDSSFGTGALKVTPGHDPNDFEIGRRHQLAQVSVIDEDGRMTAEAGPYAGQDRFKARAGVVQQLEREGLLVKVEDHRHAVGHCDRCGTIVEPLVSTQWFVRIKPLAEEAINAVEDGRTRIVPENWSKTYFDWMLNIHDWCISRQLWWGHRIPAWYCERCGRTIVAEDAPDRCECGGSLRQDPDVLDTWFSSGLWPFSTMGWPERTIDLSRYYPTDLLITGFDIIFFWVARMMMLGLRFGHDVPFRTACITGLVRDAQGQKMSKSKGNVVDPLVVMDDIGADAFRFALAGLASPGMDIALSEGRLRGARLFINKIWNASRFLLINLGPALSPVAGQTPHDRRLPPLATLDLIHRWILDRVSHLAGEIQGLLGEFRFDQAAERLYQFFWHEYADWYVEMVKSHLQSTGETRDAATAVILEVHDRVLRLLHPFTPFITEEIWQQLPKAADVGRTLDGTAQTIALATYPTIEPSWHDSDVVARMELIKAVTTTIRTARAERGVPPSRKVSAMVTGAEDGSRAVLTSASDYVKRLANLEALEFRQEVTRSPDTVRRVVREMQIHIPLAGIVDREAERRRLEKDVVGKERQRRSLETQLANPDFLERADPDIVGEKRALMETVSGDLERLRDILQELGG
ncbi:MAG: valine--tRNA ligase [Acidobacteria bacterium]|nr:valine--tRNA ligase [Acidobacteriota bacterium]